LFGVVTRFSRIATAARELQNQSVISHVVLRLLVMEVPVLVDEEV